MIPERACLGRAVITFFNVKINDNLKCIICIRAWHYGQNCAIIYLLFCSNRKTDFWSHFSDKKNNNNNFLCYKMKDRKFKILIKG